VCLPYRVGVSETPYGSGEPQPTQPQQPYTTPPAGSDSPVSGGDIWAAQPQQPQPPAWGQQNEAWGQQPASAPPGPVSGPGGAPGPVSGPGYAPPPANQLSPYAQPQYPPPPQPQYPPGYQPAYDQYGRPYSDKSKVVAGVLGIALGSFGVGRFYTGHVGLGVAQLLVSVFTCGLGHIWGLVDGIMILVNGGTDAQGRILRD
jgi:TM2 domain-containing membrane protein YozV